MTAEAPTLRAAPLAGAWAPSATPVLFYLSVGLIAGAIIALQIAVMRIFSIASWAHFGSLVISIAMLGFGIASAVMCVGKARIEREPGSPRARSACSPSGHCWPRPTASPRWCPSTRSSWFRTRSRSSACWPISCSISRPSCRGRCSWAWPSCAGRRPSGGSISPISGLGPGRACLPGRALSAAAGAPAAGAAWPLVRERACLVQDAARYRRARPAAAGRRAGHRRSTSLCRRSKARPTRASAMPATSPMPSASTRRRAPSAISRSIAAPISTSRPASPTWRRSICRACRPTPISACSSTATGRSASSRRCRTIRPPISASCRCICPMW